ncbi:unnamed protein product [Meganyctiphanes norvegica]|uniref:Uncharacterized protein n=1 Tax=Meganyctiphanes norvegica TaxID=48144 RepID=A0AAV2QE07_MEGNR
MSSNFNEVKPDIDSDSSSSDSGDEENSTPIDEEIRNIAIAEEEKMSNEDSSFTKPHNSDVQGVDDSISGDSTLVGDTENHTKEPMLDTQSINNETSIGEESNSLENGDSEGGASKEISDDNIRKDSDDAGNKDSDFNIIKESDDEIKKANENDLIKISEDSSSSDFEDESKDPVDKPKEDFKDILQSLTEQNFEHKTPVDKVNKDSEDDIHHDSGSNLNKDSDVESNNKDDRDSDWIVIGSKEGDEKDLIKDTEDSSSSDSDDEVNNDPVDKSKEDFKDILQSLKKQNFEHKTPEKKELHQETYTNIIPASPEKRQQN